MMLVLRPPRNGPFLLSRKPLPELIASLQTSSKAYQHWAVAFTMLGVSLLAAAGTQHALIWTRQQRMRRAAEKALRQRAAAGGGADVAAASDATADGEQDGGIARGLCVVCLERPCDTVFPACGHMCACSRCSGALPRCPICRSRAPAIRVYTT
jgi:E3 ubiquitin-protein ligase MUL1